MPVDTLGLEVGYRLIPLVDKGQNGELLKRIKGIRKKFAQEVGFLAPPVHIRDNLELKPSAYRITLKGVEVGSGEAMNGQFLAINPGMASGTLPGLVTTDPAFGLPATWIDANLKDDAQSMGYTVVDAGTVIATHLNHLITTHAAELLGRMEVQALLDHLGKEAPKLVEDLVPKVVSLSTLQKVLQNLLNEGVHIRDMRTVIETLSEHGPSTQDANDLTTADPYRPGPRHRPAVVPGHGRAVRDDPGQPPRASAGAGHECRRRRYRHRAGPGRHHRPAGGECVAAAGSDGLYAGAAGAGAAAYLAVALPAPGAAAAESAVAFGDSGVEDDSRDQPGWRGVSGSAGDGGHPVPAMYSAPHFSSISK
jgi:hypothetical protein